MSVVEPPPEANDPALSSAEKDEFFANAPDGDPSAQADEAPEEHSHRSYDVKARNATIEDADFEAEETNRKGGDE